MNFRDLRIVFGVVVFLAVATVSTAHAQPIPSDGFTATGSPGNDPMLALNGTGLYGTYPDEVHENGEAPHYWYVNMWYGYEAPGSPLEPWFKVDLGQSYNLEAMRVWNWNQNVDLWLGAADSNIYYSNDVADPGNVGAPGWTLLTSTTFTKATGSNSYGPPDEVDFGGNAARWVVIEMLNSHDGDPWPGGVGLSEVQFVKVIPEPSTAVLAGFGLLSLAVWGWRRRH